MTDTPARQLEESSLLPNYSCASISSTPKNQEFSKVRLPFSTVRLPSQEQFSKTKIMQLQEELIRLRKECSQKECYYSKQKNTLLSRIQLLAEQNTQLKHRNQSLTQLNLTLQLAMNSQEQSKSRIQKKQSHQLTSLREELSVMSKTSKQLKTRIEEYKKYIRRLQQQKYRFLEEKERKIIEITNINKVLLSEKEDQQNKLSELVNKRYCSQEMVQAIQKVFDVHLKQDISLDQGEVVSNYFEESPIPKRRTQGDRRVGGRSSKAFDNSYSRISSRSFINELNPPIPSEPSYEEQEPQRLLCEICRKVYQEQQFVRHMDQCQQMNNLYKKRQQLEKAIHTLDEQQRKSVSQRKWKQKNEQRQPLQPVFYQNYHNDKSQSKFMSKSPIRARPEAVKKIVVQLNRPQTHGYRSNNFY